MARNDGRRVEPGDSLSFDGDAWDVTQVRPEDGENGRIRMMRKNSGELPIVVEASVGDVEIDNPGGRFVGGIGRIHGSVSSGLSGDGDDGVESCTDAHDVHGTSQDTDDRDDRQDGQDGEPAQAALSDFSGGDN